MIKVALALGALLLSSSVAAADSYLCVADMAAGFSFEKTARNWKSSTLIPKGKYIVSRSTRKGFTWEVKEVGDKDASILCKDDFSEKGALVCDGFTQFRMNRTSGRFLAVYVIGYWTDDKNAKEGELFREGADTPHMEIGKCSPL